MTDLQAVGSTPLSSFVSIGDYEVYQETTSSFNGNDVDGKIIRVYKRGPVPWRAGIAMVVFASLAAVAVLIVKCVAAFRRERGKSVIERSLSEKAEDSSDSEGDVECAVGEGSGSLSLPQQSTSAGGQEEDVEPPSAKRARLDSSSADGGAGETSRISSEADAALGLLLLSQQQPQESSSPSAVEARETFAPSGSPASPSSPQPSTSSGLLAQRPDPVVAGRLHAPARLPRLHDPNHGEVFDPRRAIKAPALFRGMYVMFRDMHKLLLKDSLSSCELTQLVRMAEKLAAHAINYETTDYEKVPVHLLLDRMARRFFVLYFVLCTFQLLGKEPSGEWWGKLVTAVPHALSARRAQRLHGTSDRQEHRRELMDMLSSAFQTVKTGNLPCAEELAELKRLMFSPELEPQDFRKGHWYFWREGDV